MRLVCFALVVAVSLGGVYLSAHADTGAAGVGGPAVYEVVQPSGQVEMAASGDPATSPDDQREAAGGDPREKTKFAVSVTYSAFFPTSGATRDNFGDVWSGFGVGHFLPERPQKWVFDWDVDLLWRNGTSEAVLLPVTAGIQRGLSKDPNRQSYVTLRAGPYYGRVDDNLQGPDESKIGANVNVALGLVIDRKYVVEARYDWFTKLAGNNFSGLTLTAGVRVGQISL